MSNENENDYGFDGNATATDENLLQFSSPTKMQPPLTGTSQAGSRRSARAFLRAKTNSRTSTLQKMETRRDARRKNLALLLLLEDVEYDRDEIRPLGGYRRSERVFIRD